MPDLTFSYVLTSWELASHPSFHRLIGSSALRHPVRLPAQITMSKWFKGRRAGAFPAGAFPKRAKLPKNARAVKNQTRGSRTRNLKRSILRRVYPVLSTLCCLVHLILSALASIRCLDLQPMLSLQWDAALEQWASKVSPKLTSPPLSMAFSMLQDAAFVCALAWSVSIIQLSFPLLREMLSLL